MKIKKTLLLIFYFFYSQITIAEIAIKNWKTSNGFNTFFVESHELPIIDININFDAGSAYDPEQKRGLANLTNHLMTLGSDNLSEDESADRFTDIGAILSNETDLDYARISLRSLSDKKLFNQAIEAFEGVISKPNFNPKVFEREKANLIALIKQQETEPEQIGERAFRKLLYPSHPYQNYEIGDLDSVNNITSDDVVNFYQNYFSANNGSIVIVGDLSKEEAKSLAEKLAAHFKKTQDRQIQIVNPTPGTQIQIDHPAAQAHLYFGAPIMKRNDPDFFPLYLGNYILGGGGFVSRLTNEIREKRGLVYSVYSYFMPHREAGPFQINLQTKKSQIDQAYSLVKKILNEFIEKGPTQQELDDAKTNMVGGFPLRLDSNKKIIEYISMMAVYNYPVDYIQQFSKNINQVSLEDIKDAFQRRLDMSKFSTVIVGKK
ncbi:MAG: pitrilysin family protein [Nitrosomonadales bacterium]